MAEGGKQALLERLADDDDEGAADPRAAAAAAPPRPTAAAPAPTHSALSGPGAATAYPPEPLQQPQASTSTAAATTTNAASVASPPPPRSGPHHASRSPLPAPVHLHRTRSGLGTVDAHVYGVICVGFDHTLGPNIEFAFPDHLAADPDLNKNLPFLALPDGAHARDEDYSYFHLLVPALAPDRTVFGISCNRQISADQLLRKGKEVTRSTVQKAIVILASKPVFGALRDKLGVVTRSFFAQRDFDDKSILVDLFNSFEAAAAAAAASSAARDQLSAERQRKDKGKGKGKAVELPGEGVLDPSAAAEGAESAASSPAALRRAVNADGRHSSREGPVAGDTLERPGMGEEEGRPLDSPPLEEKARAAEENGEMYMGTSLRELVYRFRFKTLMLLKLIMLQRRVMFYAANTPVEQLCTFQYSLVTLIPALLTNLEDSASPALDERSQRREKPSSLRTSDKYSLIRYLGLPLDVFGKDSFFQPYLPLQQIDLLKTRTYLVGTTNSIFQQQRECHIDVLVNIDSATLEILNPKLTALVTLTAADRKWMDEIVTTVDQSWNAADPSRPLGQGFIGSDDFIRAKFEEYVCSLLACVKFGDFLSKERGERVEMLLSAPELESYNPASYNVAFIKAFKHTAAYESWDRMTDEAIFDLVEPKHPMEGKTNPLEDVGIRLVHGLHDSLQDVTLPNLSQLPGNLNLQNINLAPLPMKARERLSKGWVSGWEAMEQLRDDWNKRVSTGSLGEQDVPPGRVILPEGAQVVEAPPPMGSPSAPASPQVGQAFLAGVDVAKSGAASLATGIGSFFGSQARSSSFFGNGSAGGGGHGTTRGAALAVPSADVNPAGTLSTSPGGTTSFLRPLSTAAAATVQASPPSRSPSPGPSGDRARVPSPTAAAAKLPPQQQQQAAQPRPNAPAGIGGFFGGLRRTLSPGPAEAASAPSTPGTASTAGESGFGTPPPLASFLGVGGWGASAATSRRVTPERKVDSPAVGGAAGDAGSAAAAPPPAPLRARDIMGDLNAGGESSEDEDQEDPVEAERERERTRRKLEGLSV